MPNSWGKPIVGKDNKKEEKGCPLVLYTVDIKPNTTHIQCLRI